MYMTGLYLFLFELSSLLFSYNAKIQTWKFLLFIYLIYFGHKPYCCYSLKYSVYIWFWQLMLDLYLFCLKGLLALYSLVVSALILLYLIYVVRGIAATVHILFMSGILYSSISYWAFSNLFLKSVLYLIH